MKNIKKKILIFILTFGFISLMIPLGKVYLGQSAMCYESKMDDGFVEKTRLEIIVAFFHGVRYEEIHWIPYDENLFPY